MTAKEPKTINEPITSILIHIIGSVALLLWGTRMVKNGFTRAYASSLRKVIASNTNNRFKAFLSGLGVTAVLQSSTATALVVSSFASKQMIGTSAALAVMIGADISTTLVAQILTFNLSILTPILLICGVFLHSRYEHGGRKKHLARALIGLGLILLSLSQIKLAALPLGQSQNLPIILGPLESEPLLALLVAALLTWLLHSSLAAVLIIASLAAGDLISMKLGLLLVLGANLGGSIIPFVMTLKMGAEARRITIGNMIMRVTSIVIIIPFIGPLMAAFDELSLAQTREIVNFHTFFNIMLACLFLPIVGKLAQFCDKIIPANTDEENENLKPLFLDNTAIDSPTLALACAARETLHIASIVEQMFIDSMIALKKDDMNIVLRIQESDIKVDTLHTAVKLYLTRVNEEALDPRESDRFLQILSFSTNLEYIGDIIENSIIALVKTKIEEKHRFSEEGFSEIKNFHQIILKNMKIAQAIFMSEDSKLARQLVDNKKEVRTAAQESAAKHFKRLKSGNAESLATSALHTDIIRDFRRVNTYTTTIAYSILEKTEAYADQRKDSEETLKQLNLGQTITPELNSEESAKS